MMFISFSIPRTIEVIQRLLINNLYISSPARHLMLDIEYTLKENRRKQPLRPLEEGLIQNDRSSLPFGKYRTDHMFLMEYSDEKWHSPRIVPYQPHAIAPGANQYGQRIFEGSKAFLHDDGEVYCFRYDKNAERLNHSADIMCMPTIPVEDQIQALEALLDVERLWFPREENACMYIRPYMIATEDLLGVKESSTYLYGLFLSPSGAYFNPDRPLKILITKEFHRAAPGGTGSAKQGGNYGGSLRAMRKARSLDASQVLYLDVNNWFIEETGVSNHFHVTDKDEIIIPHFRDTILKSVTACTFLDLEEKLHCPIHQKHVPFADFLDGIDDKTITEAGVLGTAVVVGGVGSYVLDDGCSFNVGDGKVGRITKRMYKTLTDIQHGRATSPQGWLSKVPHF